MADRIESELPPGWQRTIRERMYLFATRSMERRWPVVSALPDETWSLIDGSGISGTAPTMLQAMCAALGIVVQRSGDLFCCNRVLVAPGEMLAFTDEDSCARAALEAFHARQQPERTPEPAAGLSYSGPLGDATGLRTLAAPVESVGEVTVTGHAIDCGCVYCLHALLERRTQQLSEQLARIGRVEAERVAAVARAEQATAALTKISAIRDSIVGMQGFNFSEHAYPLVAALDEAGYPGAGYKIARENLGTLVDQRNAATARAADLESSLAERKETASELSADLIDASRRATEAERLLRDAYEYIAKQGHPGDYACEVCQPGSPMLRGDGWLCMAHRARKHLSTLPGSKDGE